MTCQTFLDQTFKLKFFINKTFSDSVKDKNNLIFYSQCRKKK